jgi:hypothetical protein
MATIASLVLQLSADDAKLQRDLRKANKTIANYAKNTKKAFANIAKITAGASVAFAGLANQSIKAADEIAKSARNAGLNTSAYQELAVAFELGGSSAEALVKTTQALSRQVRDLGRGLSTQRDAFDALGLSFEGLVKLSPEEQLLKVIAALQGMENVSERSAIAQQILGRAGKELGTIMSETAGSLSLARDRARDLGLSIGSELLGNAEKANDSMFLLGESIKANFTKAILEALPVSGDYDDKIKAIGEAVKALTLAFINFGSWVAQNSGLIAGFFIAYSGVKILKGVIAMGVAFKALTAALLTYRTAITGAAIAQALLNPVAAAAGLAAAAVVASSAYLIFKDDADDAKVSNDALADSLQRVADLANGLPVSPDTSRLDGVITQTVNDGPQPKPAESPHSALSEAEVQQLKDHAAAMQAIHDAAVIRNEDMLKDLELTNQQTAADQAGASVLEKTAAFEAGLMAEKEKLEASFRVGLLDGAKLTVEQDTALQETTRLIGVQTEAYKNAATAAASVAAAQQQGLVVQQQTEKVGAYASMATSAAAFFETVAEGSKAGFLLAQGAALAQAYIQYAQGGLAATMAGINMTASLALNPLTALTAPAAGTALAATLTTANTVAFGMSVATIAAQTVQGLETGGFVNQGGQFLVGERGPEMVNLPKGSAVVDNARTDRMLSGGGGSRIDHVVNNINVGFGRNSQSTADAIAPRVLTSLRQGEIDRSGFSQIPKTRRL